MSLFDGLHDPVAKTAKRFAKIIRADAPQGPPSRFAIPEVAKQQAEDLGVAPKSIKMIETLGMGHAMGEHTLGVLLAEAYVVARAEVRRLAAERGEGEACSSCGRRGIVLSVCSRCKAAKYCGKDCQKQAWKEHKRLCTELANEFEGIQLARRIFLYNLMSEKIQKYTTAP
eukprot:CAMPEP_0174893878 /NCGR_PEP_ID=MMETSP0167-20121228/8611_1 /TAXON_ID=38298 /ORGANISM="Rhodella maculata, Strain CCMP736" /LENGTH=170 /DNA_ID=CAMNT_0016132793 /DNA_START=360 /DNA_END=875 /DNA_ORIENTATION=+